MFYDCIIDCENVFDHAELKELHQKLQRTRIPGEIKWDRDQRQCQITQAIETLLAENNEKYSRFPNDHIHCQMSLDVYRENIRIGDTLNKCKHWRVLEIYEIEMCCYFAVLYINEKLGQFVLAHRGNCVNFKNLNIDKILDTNLNGILLNNMIVQQEYCFGTTQKANALAIEKDFFLSFTGYSNGAWLAEQCNFFSVHFLKNKNTKAVLFDSPGIFHDLNKINLNDHVLSKSTLFDMNELCQVNYLTAPCFTNSINLHTGQVYRIFVDVNDENDSIIDQVNTTNTSPSKITDFFKFMGIGDIIAKKLTLSKFFFNGLMSMFDHKVLKAIEKIFDEKTGKPVYYEEIKNWPLINFKKIENGTDDMDQVKELIKEEAGGLLDHLPIPSFVSTIGKDVIDVSCSVIQLAMKLKPGIALLCNVCVKLMKGEIDASSFEDEKFYLRLKDLKRYEQEMSSNSSLVSNEYSMKIVKHYEPICDMTKKTEWKLCPKFGNIDWCLIKLHAADLNEKSPLILKLYNNLINSYKIKDSEKNIFDNYEQFLQSDKLSYENIVEKMVRLIQIFPEIRMCLQMKSQVIYHFYSSYHRLKIPILRKQTIFQEI